MSNPTVNQIASAYKFQPEKLGQKVEQDKKQNNGLPKDLRQLMAFNDIATGRQNMGIQQALQTPTNMPTVAQDIQERARQALQARMMQQVQAQQRKDGQPNVVPPGVPRPPEQAQGLDSLTSNVGEEYAEGGIIGHTQHFQSKGSVQDPEAKKEEESTSMGGDLLRAIANAISGGVQRTVDYGKLKSQQEEAVPGFFESLTPTQRAERQKKAALLATQMGQVADTGEVKTPYPTAGKPSYDRPVGEEDFAREQAMQLRKTPAIQAAMAAQPPAPRPNAPRPTNAQAPRPPGGLTDLVAPKPEVDSDAMKIQKQVMNRNADTEAAKLAQQYEKDVGKKDTSQYDRLIAELETRKKGLEGPTDAFGRLKEYFAQFDGAGTWQEAGSKAAGKQTALQKARAQEQFDLAKQAIEIAGKKADADYDYKKGIFDLKTGEKKRVYDQAYDAAKAVGKTEAEAKKWAEEQLLREREMKNRMATANVNHDNLMNRARALMAADPTKKMTLEEAMQRASLAADAGKLSIAETRAGSDADKTRAKIAEKYAWIDMLPANDPTKKMMTAERDKALARVGGGGAGLPNAVPSASKGQVQFLGYE
jgi:hypothetical protein